MIIDEVYLHYVHMIIVMGNSNTGVNMKIVLDESSVTHEILDCSEEFLVTLKQLVNRVESLEMQQPQFIEFLCEKTYFLFMKEFGDHYSISPSFHRVLYHFTEFLDFFQSQGITIGYLSEQAIEATNFDSKQNVLRHSYRGSYEQQNLDCFRKSWWVSDPCILY